MHYSLTADKETVCTIVHQLLRFLQLFHGSRLSLYSRNFLQNGTVVSETHLRPRPWGELCEVVFGKSSLLKSNNFAREIIAALSSQDTPRGGIVCVSHRPLFLYRLLRSVSCLSRTIPRLVLAHTTNLYTESGIRRLQNHFIWFGSANENWTRASGVTDLRTNHYTMTKYVWIWLVRPWSRK